MKLKVIHLIRRLERIERDLEELQNLENSLSPDREYASRLYDSMQEEEIRLSNMKNRILSQVVKNPPQNLSEIPIPHFEITTPEIKIPADPPAETRKATSEKFKETAVPNNDSKDSASSRHSDQPETSNEQPSGSTEKPTENIPDNSAKNNKAESAVSNSSARKPVFRFKYTEK